MPATYDVLIIGAGPAGLAVAARLKEATPAAAFNDVQHERYRYEHNRRRRGQKVTKQKELSILVLDSTAPAWLGRWDRLFSTMGISHLRSPMHFQLDPRHDDGLVRFTHEHGRQCELVEIQGCAGRTLRKANARGRKVKALAIDQRRLDYFQPGTRLFRDHCDELVQRYHLNAPETVLHETVRDIGFDTRTGLLSVQTEQQQPQARHLAKTVVLAVGPANEPVFPPIPSLHNHPGLTHAMHLIHYPPPALGTRPSSIHDRILIVGGGLTSVQIAHLALRRRASHVHLLMRGPLKVRHFDIPLTWVDRLGPLELSRYHALPTDADRRETYSAVRAGGSVNPVFRDVLDKYIRESRISLHLHSEVNWATTTWDAGKGEWTVGITTAATTTTKQNDDKLDSGSLEKNEQQQKVTHIPHIPHIHHIFLATGVQTDVSSLPYLQSLLREYPIDTADGLPCITQDLAWRDDVPLFVTGGLAALRLGPGAPNLVGARAGAERVAGSVLEYLKRRDGWKVDEESDMWTEFIKGNRFAAFAAAEE